MDDYLKTVISQYFASPSIRALVDAFEQWKNPNASIGLLYNDVLNLDTAIGYGLDRWGRIVGIGRVFNAANGQHFGFAEAQDLAESGFGWGECFYSGGFTLAPVVLDDADYRTLILAKALGNVSDGSISSYNAILMTLFGSLGPCYVIDNLNMSITYRFEGFYLPPMQSGVFYQSGVIPRPVGVSMTVLEG